MVSRYALLVLCEMNDFIVMKRVIEAEVYKKTKIHVINDT